VCVCVREREQTHTSQSEASLIGWPWPSVADSPGAAPPLKILNLFLTSLPSRPPFFHLHIFYPQKVHLVVMYWGLFENTVSSSSLVLPNVRRSRRSTLSSEILTSKRIWQNTHANEWSLSLSRSVLRCDTRFQRAFTACGYVFNIITMVWTNQCNYFKNATPCSKCTR
jgi:hypothetical protein